jgi:hypothetical protein
VAERCGIAAPAIRELAHSLAATERAVVYGRIGTCTQEYGTLASWLVELPMGCLAEEIATPGDGQIKVLFTISGNPVLSAPNGPVPALITSSRRFSRTRFLMPRVSCSLATSRTSSPSLAKLRANDFGRVFLAVFFIGGLSG